MLFPINTSGGRPPFFMVHGLHGVMPLGGIMGAALGADQPLYVVNAQGIDGREPPHERIEDMLATYLAEIRRARETGPYVIGGFCGGGLLALSLARSLWLQGEPVGTVIMVDPPLMPFSRVPLQRDINPKDPHIYRQLWENTDMALRRYAQRYEGLPYDVRKIVQYHAAIETGIATTVMLYRYTPPVFEGPTEFIISSERAFAHFHPESPWRSVVPKPGRYHVIPGSHDDFFFVHLEPVLGLIRFGLSRAQFGRRRVAA
jgi:thioesterase domain-containing protein